MNEASAKAKQQIVDKIKSTTNILVTVSRDPSVDELSAALGLTALLNKLDKHATAIFSGLIPPAISFLEPDKTFENTADSLRDFIIALDKEKADHLRYKVEGDLVKIFITPYRTVIDSNDLEFSQGDFNIELVLALGVSSQEHLDTALSAHGQIMHDVTIVTLSAGDQISQLGSVDWRDEGASSLSEMVAGLSESLKTDTILLDKQISTALLTGIVAATDRFSNARTTSKVMATAAQLMASGADQQLIAAKLQEAHTINALPNNAIEEQPTASAQIEQVQSTVPTGDLMIRHDTPTVEVPVIAEEPPIVEEEPAPYTTVPSQPAETELPPLTSPLKSAVPTIDEILGETPRNVETAIPESDKSTFGGTLNATTDQAAEDARRELEDQQNKTILSHTYLSGSDDDSTTAINGIGQNEDTQTVDIFAGGLAPTIQPTVTMPLPPPLPDFSTLPPASTSIPAFPDMSAPYAEPPALSTLPPEPTADNNDPSQFKIPGQQ